MEDHFNSNVLVEHLNRKLALVEIERQLMELSNGLLNDEVYSRKDAIKTLFKVLTLIEVEREVIMNEIKLSNDLLGT